MSSATLRIESRSGSAPGGMAAAWKRGWIFYATPQNDEDVPRGGLDKEISMLFAKVGLESDIPELRGHEIKPPSFE